MLLGLQIYLRLPVIAHKLLVLALCVAASPPYSALEWEGDISGTTNPEGAMRLDNRYDATQAPIRV